jgi:hypothetical protein
VTIDGVATPATVDAEHRIYTTAPRPAPGGVEIVVTNPDGRSIRLEKPCTYVDELNQKGDIRIRPGDSMKDCSCCDPATSCRRSRA